jgi:hypothetical protein
MEICPHFLVEVERVLVFKRSYKLLKIIRRLELKFNIKGEPNSRNRRRKFVMMSE